MKPSERNHKQQNLFSIKATHGKRYTTESIWGPLSPSKITGVQNQENMSEYKRKLYASHGLLCNLPAKRECGKRVVCVKSKRKRGWS